MLQCIALLPSWYESLMEQHCRLAEAAALAAAQAEAAQQDAHDSKLAAAQQADKASLLQQKVQLAQQRQAQVHAAIRIRTDARQWHLKTQEAAARAYHVCSVASTLCALCMHVAFTYTSLSASLVLRVALTRSRSAQ